MPSPRIHAIYRYVLLLLSVALLLLLLSAHLGRGDAYDTCSLYAAPNGDDAAAGSLSAPLRNPQVLVDALEPGQTGCLLEGSYDAQAQGVKISTPGITLTSATGAEAKLIGRLWVAEGADGVTVSRLNIDGLTGDGAGGPVINADNVTFDEDDVTNDHTSICFILGSPEYGVAENTLIENSRIHDCGVLPAGNHDHGIYVEDTRNAIIRDNWIYDNADRGIQLYPHAVGSQIYGNVIDGNGQGIIFSSSGDQASEDNIVYGNIISNSTIRWNVESYWGEGTVGSGNVVHDNCVWASNQDDYYNQAGGIQPVSAGAEGFDSEDNIISEPHFVDPAGGNFNLQGSSSCQVSNQAIDAPTESPPFPAPGRTPGADQLKAPKIHGYAIRKLSSGRRPGSPKYVFRFHSVGAASYRCKLDKKPFRHCVSPIAYRHLPSHRHVFKAKALDTVGNASPSRSFVFFAAGSGCFKSSRCSRRHRHVSHHRVAASLDIPK